MTPPSDRERILCAMFESFCVAAIRNFGSNLRRAMRNHQKYDGTGEVSVEYLIGLLSSEDVYASEQFVLDVDGLPCVLENELLYNALLSLPDSERKVILYDFWHDWKDKEISKKLEVTVRTVYNLRQRAFSRLPHPGGQVRPHGHQAVGPGLAALPPIFRKCQISVHQKTRCQESPWQRGKNNYGLQETGAFQGSRDRTTSG